MLAFHKHLLSAYCIPGNLLDSRGLALYEADRSPSPHGAYTAAGFRRRPYPTPPELLGGEEETVASDGSDPCLGGTVAGRGPPGWPARRAETAGVGFPP